ncbi:MAG: hypothetical protein H6704_20585 [Myxococcales bacterium]|nr:hypothetical protein [Myxococcales bacterium]
MRLTGRTVLVVGAGPVGRRRVAALRAAGATVRWVAPDVPAAPAVTEAVAAPFDPAHLRGALLAFACAPPTSTRRSPRPPRARRGAGGPRRRARRG